MRIIYDNAGYLRADLSLFDSDKLSQNAKAALRGNDRAVSIASLWEMAIKVSLGKLRLSKSITQIAALCEGSGIALLPITPEDCEAMQALPFIHKDPFDRIIIAQSINRGAPIVTDDEKIWLYDRAEKIW